MSKITLLINGSAFEVSDIKARVPTVPGQFKEGKK